MRTRVANPGSWRYPEFFEWFARDDTSRSRCGGSTGLGLAVVAAVVKAHHGTIEVNSVPGRNEFVGTLPAARVSNASDV